MFANDIIRKLLVLIFQIMKSNMQTTRKVNALSPLIVSLFLGCDVVDKLISENGCSVAAE